MGGVRGGGACCSHRSGMHRVGVDGGWRWGPGPWEMACIHPGRLRSGVYMLGGRGSGRGCGEDTHRAGTSGVRACVRGAVRVGLPLMAQAAIRGCRVTGVRSSVRDVYGATQFTACAPA